MKLGKGTCYGHDLKRLNGEQLFFFLNRHSCTAHSQKWPHWKRMGSKFQLVETFGTALRPNKIELKAYFLRNQHQIWNTICLDSWL